MLIQGFSPPGQHVVAGEWGNEISLRTNRKAADERWREVVIQRSDRPFMWVLYRVVKRQLISSN